MAEPEIPNATGEDAEAPLCAAPDAKPRKPKIVLPPGACDTHAHICGPKSAHPYAPRRIYTPPDALLGDYLEMLGTLGVERAVLVQPSVYGTDNTVLMEALAKAGPRCRAVAVVDEAVTDADIERLHNAGVRGLRFNLVDVADPSGAIPLGPVTRLAERVKPLGWHAEFLIHVDDYPGLDAMFAEFPTEIVIGHMGYMRPGRDIGEAGFEAMVRLAGAGKCWVKLTGPYRISAGDLPYGEVTPVARALVEAAPGRVIWGTDWPHVMVTKPMPNDGDLCDLLADWVPDPELRKRVLVDNPAQLYGFDRS